VGHDGEEFVGRLHQTGLLGRALRLDDDVLQLCEHLVRLGELAFGELAEGHLVEVDLHLEHGLNMTKNWW